jgi:hypothetical protein
MLLLNHNVKKIDNMELAKYATKPMNMLATSCLNNNGNILPTYLKKRALFKTRLLLA